MFNFIASLQIDATISVFLSFIAAVLDFPTNAFELLIAGSFFESIILIIGGIKILKKFFD